MNCYAEPSFNETPLSFNRYPSYIELGEYTVNMTNPIYKLNDYSYDMLTAIPDNNENRKLKYYYYNKNKGEY